jgi:hypothetical protein
MALEKVEVVDCASLRGSGWIRLPVEALGPDGPGRLSKVAAMFKEMMERSSHPGGHRADGQDGFVEDGHEGTGGLREVRSHLVLNQGFPSDHPLSSLMPWFFGSGDRSFGLHALHDEVAPLLTRVDALTLAIFESIELQSGLPFGELSSRIALGERMLRFHWYPKLSGGRLSTFDVTVNGTHVRMIGYSVESSRENMRTVRVSPHTDTGHWTWQLWSTDAQLRFAGENGDPIITDRGTDWIYGNAGDFLEHEGVGIRAPIHWVDLDESAENSPRVSVACFAHARPTAAFRDGTLAGGRLFERLRELGYVDEVKTAEVHRLLAASRLRDELLVGRCVAWEAANGLPPGFGVGASRYFVNDEATGLAVRRKEPLGRPGDQAPSI